MSIVNSAYVRKPCLRNYKIWNSIIDKLCSIIFHTRSLKHNISNQRFSLFLPTHGRVTLSNSYMCYIDDRVQVLFYIKGQDVLHKTSENKLPQVGNFQCSLALFFILAWVLISK